MGLPELDFVGAHKSIGDHEAEDHHHGHNRYCTLGINLDIVA